MKSTIKATPLNMNLESILEACAVQIARTQSALDEATANRDDYRKKRDSIKRRIAGLTEQREAILDRRAKGDENDGDSARHALLVADAERLCELLLPAEADLEAAEKVLTQATFNRNSAQSEHEQTVAMQGAEALTQRLLEIESVWLAGVARLSALKRAATPEHRYLHPREIYAPSDALVRLVTQGVLPEAPKP